MVGGTNCELLANFDELSVYTVARREDISHLRSGRKPPWTDIDSDKMVTISKYKSSLVTHLFQRIKLAARGGLCADGAIERR